MQKPTVLVPLSDELDRLLSDPSSSWARYCAQYTRPRIFLPPPLAAYAAESFLATRWDEITTEFDRLNWLHRLNEDPNQGGNWGFQGFLDLLELRCQTVARTCEALEARESNFEICKIHAVNRECLAFYLIACAIHPDLHVTAVTECPAALRVVVALDSRDEEI